MIQDATATVFDRDCRRLVPDMPGVVHELVLRIGGGRGQGDGLDIPGVALNVPSGRPVRRLRGECADCHFEQRPGRNAGGVFL